MHDNLISWAVLTFKCLAAKDVNLSIKTSIPMNIPLKFFLLTFPDNLAIFSALCELLSTRHSLILDLALIKSLENKKHDSF